MPSVFAPGALAQSLAALLGISAVALGLVACGDKAKGAPEPNGSGAPQASAAPPGTAPVASAGATATAAVAKADAALAGAWKGKFTTQRTKIDLPSDAPDKTWAKDDGKTAVGDGAIELTIAETGDVTGKTTGVLGAGTLRGKVDEGKVSAALTPDDPKADGAMTGYVDLDFAGGKLTGELRASGPDAAIVREAPLTLEKAR